MNYIQFHFGNVWRKWFAATHGGVTTFLGSPKISLSEEKRLKDTQNLKCEDRR